MFAIKGNQRHCQMIIKGVYFYHYWLHSICFLNKRAIHYVIQKAFHLKSDKKQYLCINKKEIYCDDRHEFETCSGKKQTISVKTYSVYGYSI